MATSRFCPSCLSTLTRRSTPIRQILTSGRVATTPILNAVNQIRTAAGASANKKKKEAAIAARKKRRARPTYKTTDLSDMPTFSLIDAMRYIRASEVGYGVTSAKYELAIRIKTLKNNAVCRGRLKLPNAINTDTRICVIAAPDSAAAKAAAEAGATLIGEETVFDAVKDGRIDFDRCLCHPESLPKLNKAGIARILGPRGLMPSTKQGTVTSNIRGAVRDMQGGSEYRERMGVVRMVIGQLGYTPSELETNIKAFMQKLKANFVELADRCPKEIHEVVLSSTHGPGMTLNGALRSEEGVDAKDLSTL